MINGKPVLLDLFSGAGGAARGYQRAGFYVVGVDIKPQPRYGGDEFHQADAMTYPLEGFDAIHASPPCQAYCALTSMWNSREHVMLIEPVRERLKQSGKLFVIENVERAPLKNALILCGSQFGLGCDEAELRRHRRFEISKALPILIMSCSHNWKAQTIAVYGHAGGWSKQTRAAVIGVYGGHGRDRRRRMNGQNYSTEKRKQAMGIDWMTGAELSQAIPPAYTNFIGQQLIQQL